MLMSGLLFAMLSMLHFIVFGRISGEDYGYYYAGAALFDMICVICTCLAAVAFGKDWHLFPLAIVMLVSIVNNLLGLFVWFYRLNSELYVMAGVFLYLMAAFVLLGSRFNVGGLLGLNRFGPFHFVPAVNRVLLDK
jgi:hypothetical protein|tara:strand:+ start:4611 stop:5018 length:408 start_codon:yes stop_codon:yes gene_type:complete